MTSNMISRVLQLVLMIVMSTTVVATTTQLNSRDQRLCEGFPCSSGPICGGGCFCSGGMCHSAN